MQTGPQAYKVQVQRYKNMHLGIHWRPHCDSSLGVTPCAHATVEARAGRWLCAQSRVGPGAGQERSAQVAVLQEPAGGDSTGPASQGVRGSM